MLIYDITAEPLSEEYKKMVRQQLIMTKKNIKMRHKNQILKKKKKKLSAKHLNRLKKQNHEDKIVLQNAQKLRKLLKKNLKDVQDKVSEKLQVFIDLLIDSSKIDEESDLD